MLKEGRSSIAPLPADRLDQALYYDEQKGGLAKTYCRMGGVVPLRPIDPALCPIRDDATARYDASYLTLCEVVGSAFRHAGYDPRDLPFRNAGVYVGNSSGGSNLQCDLAYHRGAPEMAAVLRQLPGFAILPQDTQEAVIAEVVEAVRDDFPSRARCTVNHFASHAAASTVTETFSFTGPSLAVDAACASSLFALQLAADALNRGQIDVAVVGGLAYRKLYEWTAIARARSMSTLGRCRPFDAAADGMISSDGYGIVIVKTLQRALAAGDRICGVIRGIGVSSDGRGKGFWAPRKEGQMAAIRRAYGEDIDPARLQYIEAHATSTQLGDATEVAALAEALAGRLSGPIPIGSVKANIGHALEAAGIASLIKTILAMQHGVVPPAANLETLNPAIEWERSPFYPPRKCSEWPRPADGHPRRAGIDSFGIGGLNVHLVVDEGLRESSAAGSRSRPQIAAQSSRAAEHEPIAIIGMGSLFPGALSVAAFRELINTGADPKRPVSEELSNGSTVGASDNSAVAGFLTDYEFDWKTFRIPPKQVAGSNPLQYMILDTARQALDDAGFANREFDRDRFATVVGAIFQNDFTSDAWQGVRIPEFTARVERSLRTRGFSDAQITPLVAEYAEQFVSSKPAVADETGSSSSSTLASRIAKQFDLMGGALAIDAGEASSLAALSAAVNLLQSKTCDVVLCAAGQQSLDSASHETHKSAGRLANGAPRATFDAQARGYVLGEGAGAVLLKRLSDAQRDGDPIRAVVRGIGSASNAESPAEAIREGLSRAIAAAEIDPDQIGLVESDVVHAPDGERLIEAVDAACPANTHGSPILLGSLDAQLGNLQAAGGMAALVKMTLALQQGEMPATFGITQPSAAVARRGDRFDPLLETRPIAATTDRGTSIAAVISFSSSGYNFGGGTAYALLLEGGANLLPRAESPVASKSRGGRATRPAAQQAASQSTPVATPPPVAGVPHENCVRSASRFVLQMVPAALAEPATSGPSFAGTGTDSRRKPLGRRASRATFRTGHGCPHIAGRSGSDDGGN